MLISIALLIIPIFICLPIRNTTNYKLVGSSELDKISFLKSDYENTLTINQLSELMMGNLSDEEINMLKEMFKTERLRRNLFKYEQRSKNPKLDRKLIRKFRHMKK